MTLRDTLSNTPKRCDQGLHRVQLGNKTCFDCAIDVSQAPTAPQDSGDGVEAIDEIIMKVYWKTGESDGHDPTVDKRLMGFMNNPVAIEAKAAIELLLREQYKKGYIAGGVDEIMRHEEARKAVEAELKGKLNDTTPN